MPFKHVLEWFDWNDNWSCFLIYASEIHWRVQTTVARRSGRFKEIHLALRTLHMSLYDDHTRRPSDPQTHNVGRTGHSFNSDTGDWWLLTNQRQKASLWLQVLPQQQRLQCWLCQLPPVTFKHLCVSMRLADSPDISSVAVIDVISRAWIRRCADHERICGPLS